MTSNCHQPVLKIQKYKNTKQKYKNTKVQIEVSLDLGPSVECTGQVCGYVQCHPGVRLGQTQTKEPIGGGDGDSYLSVCLSSLCTQVVCPLRMHIHTSCFWARRNMCVCG